MRAPASLHRVSAPRHRNARHLQPVYSPRRGGSHIPGCVEDLPRRNEGGQRPQPGNRGRRVPRPRRPVGLRQDDRAADGRRSRGHLRGAAEDRRADRQLRAVARPRHRDGLPELRALPASHRLRQHRLQPEAEEDGQEGDRPAHQRSGAAARPRRRTSTASRERSPAASGSAWRWAARSCASRPRS